MTAPRCDHCPAPAGVGCPAHTRPHPRYCELARPGRKGADAWRAHLADLAVAEALPEDLDRRSTPRPDPLPVPAPPATPTPTGDEPAIDEWDFITEERLAADTRRLLARVPAGVDGVVAIARSGLQAGWQVACARHVPLWTVSRSRGVLGPGHGGRMEGTDRPAPRHLLLIDDTAALGREMAANLSIVRAAFPGAEVTRAVIYAHPSGRPHVDLCAAIYPGLHYLAWNWCNAGHGQECAYDFDGILCRDCLPEEDDDGPRYLRFLRDAEPLYLPRRAPVPMIVTARHEKYRCETIGWLVRHGVRVQSLVMRDWPIDPARSWPEQVGAWKAWVYARSSCALFAESDPDQAVVIAANTGRAVLCPALGRVLPPRAPDPAPSPLAAANDLTRRIALCVGADGHCGCGSYRCPRGKGPGGIVGRMDCEICEHLPAG